MKLVRYQTRNSHDLKGTADLLEWFDNRYVSGALVISSWIPVSQGANRALAAAGSAGSAGFSASAARDYYLAHIKEIDERIEYLDGCANGGTK